MNIQYVYASILKANNSNNYSKSEGKIMHQPLYNLKWKEINILQLTTEPAGGSDSPES